MTNAKISGKLLEKLACPSCKKPLKLNAQDSRLDCISCGLGYPIVDDIPVLLVNEAKKIK